MLNRDVGFDLGWIEDCDPESYRQSLRDEDLATIESHCPSITAAAAAASRNAPPNIAELSKDKTTIDGAKSVFESRALAAEIARIEGLIAFIKALETGIRSEIRERSDEVIREISDDMGTMWKALHPGLPIENVRL